MFNGPENHRKCQQRQRDKFFSKIPIFFVAKHNVVVDLYLSMRKLSNLSRHVAPFGNLSLGVFFSVDLFSRLKGVWILPVQLLEAPYSIS